MPLIKLTSEIVAAAITGFEVERDRIQVRIAEIRQLLGSPAGATAPSETAKPRKKRSAAVRRRMKLAQQLRWKKIREGGEPAQPSGVIGGTYSDAPGLSKGDARYVRMRPQRWGHRQWTIRDLIRAAIRV